MPRTKQDHYFNPTPDTAAAETKNGTIIVDAVDADLLKAADVNGGYARWYSHNENDRPIRFRLHRVVMERMTGAPIPDGMLVDHINHNTLDNRRSNLRLCTKAENNRNAKRRSDNSLGLKGVSFEQSKNKFRARIKVNGKQRSLGHFDTAEEAHAAYVAKARELYGEYANDGDGCLVLR